MDQPETTSTKHDNYERDSLSGGGTLLHQFRSNPPVFVTKVFFPVGSAHDSEGAEGLAHLTARNLLQHTGERTMTEMNRHRSRYGFRLSASVRPDYTVLSFRSLEEHADRLLDLVREVLTQPGFDPETVGHLRDQQESDLRQRRDDTFRYAFDRALEEFYGNHPYAHPALGRPDSLDELSADRVRSFFESSYAENDIVISSVGPVESSDLRATLDDLDLPGRTPTLTATQPQQAGNTRSTITRSVDQPTHVLVQPAASMGDSKYVPFKVTETLLGGGMGSILFQRLREERSLGYQVGASYPSRRDQATMRFYLGGGSAEGEEFRSVLRTVLDELSQEGPAGEDLQKAREYRNGSFRLDHESPGKVAWYRGFYETMGRGAEFDQRYTDAVDAVDPESVRNVAEDLRNAGSLHLTVLPN